MPIVARCGKCGKQFKARDELGGKTVRCPSCQGPIRIPAAPAAPAGSSSSPAPASQTGKAKAPNVEAALLKIEEARKKRSGDAESEAATRDEMNKLVQAYDQLSGKGAKPGKPGEKAPRAGEQKTQVTVVTKVQDRVGMLKSTLFWKYAVIIAFLLIGGTASTFFIGRVMTHSTEETQVHTYGEMDRKKFLADAEAALKAKKYARCHDLLEDFARAFPQRVKNLDYLDIKQRLEKAVNQ